MYNIEVSLLFSQIADFLEVDGVDSEVVKAYRNAIQEINSLPYCLEETYKVNGYVNLKKLAKHVKSQIEEILLTGSCAYYYYLKEKIPSDLLTLLSIPGVSPKAVGFLYKQLNLTNFSDVKEMAKKRKLRLYSPIGVKTEQNILRGIRMIEHKGEAIPLGVALLLAQRIMGILQYLPQVERLNIIGSVRRMKEIVQNLDLLVATKKRREVLDFFSKLYFVEKILIKDFFRVSVIIDIGIKINLYVVEPENYLNSLHYYTGTPEYKDKLKERAQHWGLKMTSVGFFTEEYYAKVAIDEERDIFCFLDLPYIPPELREGEKVLEAADLGKLSKLVEVSDIKGDLHVHTKWSDGANTIEEMMQTARGKGYQYLAITDHSKSLALARGLGEDRLDRQLQEIAELNSKYDDFHLLSGIEVDILPNGDLDFEDKILEKVDIVAASIHSHFRQNKETMTKRITSALKNPCVTFLSHPTGRLLGRRYPYEMDFPEILDTASKNGKFLEINSSPDRLDLNDVHANMAKKAGVPLVINTDAHGKDNLDYMSFGVAVARRAWLEDKEVINTLPWEQLQKRIKK